jgi:hypothetical protein
MPILFRRRRPPEPEPKLPVPRAQDSPSPADLVALYLRAQNLEQVLRTDEAIQLYEQAVSARFDAAGPYDRLIAIYRARDAHAEVVRVATAALETVRTHDAKRDWYAQMRDEAEEAAKAQPDKRGAEF